MKVRANDSAIWILVILMAGCAAETSESDAYGNFEATEITVAAELGGRLVSLGVNEGDRLRGGQVVGRVDTVQISLRRDQVLTQLNAVRARFPGIASQGDVLESQRRVALRELARVEGLLEDGAATSKQFDDASGQIEVLERQIAAVRSQNAPVHAELDVLRAQIALLDDQINRARLVNPVDGTVLVVYAHETEMTAPGRAIYKIASLDTLELRAYVSGSQLAGLTIGQDVHVRIDAGADSLRSLPGRVTWIASEAEFTPKLIQTREERVQLVYAFKVSVPNSEGLLKIGMPGEVAFSPEPN